MEALRNTSILWMIVGGITLVILLFTKIRAPYGRHTREGWGAMIDNKWGWFFMELPALLIMPLLSVLGPREKDVTSWILIGLWVLHYANRTLIFPFRLRTRGKKMPLSIVMSAIFFNCINGLLNGLYFGFYGPDYISPYSVHFIIGMILFFLGLGINWMSDTKLIRLRKNNHGYQIPQGGLFRFISCPNHFGEMVEWAGFAIAAWSAPALSFFIWTVCNLLPRALNHHTWYRENFAQYPQERKAVIPYLV